MPSLSIKGLTSRRGLIALAASLGMVVAGITAASVNTSGKAYAASLSTGPTRNVIVVLKNQHTDLSITKGRASSARVNAFHSDQAPLLAKAKTDGAHNVRGYTVLNGFSATVTQAQANVLSADPSVAAIYPDLTITAVPVKPDHRGGNTPPPANPPDTTSICPSNPAQPLLEPEALAVTHDAFDDSSTPSAQQIVDGTGVKVAFIADGIDVNNPDFTRADGSHVFVDYQDFSGEGPEAPSGAAEAFGDASAIAAQGRETYDLANFVSAAHPLPPGCNIRILGMAPGASLIGLKVFGNANTAPTSRFIEAIQYAVTDGADVLNESFGGNPFPDTGDDPISLADDAAIAAGVTVVASSGDAGTTNTIGSPGSSGQVISVAATTTFQSYIQDTYAGAQLSNGTFASNNISGLSSGGITQSGRTPDLAAPGDLGWALCSTNTAVYEECTNDNGDPSPVQNFGGTSQSSPLTAGAAALVIEAYEHTHHGVRPSPSLVREFLTSTATDLGHPAYEQGAGLLNSLAAVQAAESYRDSNGHPARVGNTLLVSKNQLTAISNPHSSVSQKITVTNNGTSYQTVHATTRTVDKVVKTISGTATLNTATAPFYLDSFEIPRSFVAQTFKVGKADRLDVSVAAQSAPSSIRVILIDPHGTYTAYSIPQGVNNFAHVDVRFPAAGTWTAYFAVTQSPAFSGPLPWKVVESDFATRGSVSPSTFTLAPGASRTVTVHSYTDSQPGDVSASVQFTSSKTTVSVPLTLRGQVPGRNTTFTGTFTGGNGRGTPGVSEVYYLTVPHGKKDLGVSLKLSDPGQLVFAYLTGPDGQVYSFGSNVSPDQTQLLNTIQLYQRNPAAGRWVLSLNIANPVSGLEVQQKYTVKVAYDTVKISAHGLPNSARTRLAAGTPVTVPVTIKNTGNAPLVYFADARLNTTGTIQLAELSGVSQPMPLPVPAGVTPFWLDPTETTSLTLVATADQPVNADFFYQSGNPDSYSAAVGNGATVTVNAPEVSPGLWATDIGQTGPFPGPAPAGSLSVSASAVGNLFDTAVTSNTGDFWQVGVDPAAMPAQAALAAEAGEHLLEADRADAGTTASPAVDPGPLTLNPGETGTILVTITPGASSGTVVRGHLYIDSVDLFTDGGQELISLPYEYTVR